jgi:hypothetical protein
LVAGSLNSTDTVVSLLAVSRFNKYGLLLDNLRRINHD